MITSDETIEIQRGIPTSERHIAAEIYYHAFRAKLTPIIGGSEMAMIMLANGFEADLGLTAFVGGHVVGIAGVHHQQRQFVRWRFADLAQHFGFLSASWRYGIASLFTRSPKSGELVMDGIAVTSAMRGRGIGTRLLEAVVAFGQAHHYDTVRLDVVNTNPDARRLYERFGFVPTVTHCYPFMRPFGFTSLTTMIKSIG